MIIFTIILLTIISTVKAAAPPPRCPSNMVQYYQNPHVCYWAVADAKSFDDAENFCNQSGGHLAPVFDQPANFFIAQNAYKTFNATDFWIGGKTYNINDALVWLWTWQNNYFIFSDWNPGQGKPVMNNCVLSNSRTALWSSADCSTAKTFVCQIPAVVDICDPEWTYFKGPNQNGMCYKYMSEPNVTFSEAQNVCLNQNANLASIHSAEENIFLAQLTKHNYFGPWETEGVFIGLHYQNSAWKWLDGTSFNFEKWAPSRPTDPVNHTIAWIYPDHDNGWWENFFPTTALYRFICEKKPNLMLVGENM